MRKLILMLMVFAPLATFAQQKFGHLNVQDVVQSLPEFIKAQGEVESQAKIYDSELKQMSDELQRKADEYQKAAPTMPDTKKKDTETELNNLYQKFQQAQQDDAQALQKLREEKLAPIQTKLQNAIKNVGDRGKYVYIMDVSAGIPYISTTLSTDVTAEVKAELNKLK
ncbi:MAG: OmpH family outer membrane protein [Prevotella sp.]|nr:OmpH family outer membrane protein [Bacteroidales bacterium]MDY4230002.1 OmpH family outer membrane protein [Prevotella sp.]MCI6102572.1 OmpH family outer membrane protein [Bacteroidales bacterium]MCI7597431.1 OmpH family outer membrane protein [Bacteroidales bacterium]MCI7652681.1 OmpH family outer membrane protein [Bacteroidales bacterium]